MIRSKYMHLVGYVDPVSKVSLVPWTYFNLKYVLELTFARITSHYGLLFSFYYIGRVLGRSFKHHTELPPLSPILTLLAFAYFILGITSRFSVICFCYVLIGFGGGILRSICFPSEEEEEKTYYSKTRTKKNDSNYCFAVIISLIFVPLFAGFTYSTSITSRNPPLVACTICGVLCLLLALKLLSMETSCFGVCCSTISDFAKRETSNQSRAEEDAVVPGSLSSLDGVTEESVDPPKNFLDVCGNDMTAAKKMYYNTLQWRALERMDEIVDIPQNPNTFQNILKYYPHGFQGRTREGAAVVYEQLGKADASGLSKSKITPQNLLRHFMLRNEFIYTKCFKNHRDGEVNESETRVEKTDDESVTQLMSILDVKGVGFYSISADVMTFIKISADAMDSHFPNVVVRLAIVNCPSWFTTVWSGIARVLPESVKKKVMFINDMKDLDEFIDPCMRPSEYGGTGCDLGDSGDFKIFLDLPNHWEKLGVQHSADSDLFVVKTETDIPRLARTEKSSLRGWLQGIVGRENVGEGNTGSTENREAFMGESNSYIYDVETGAWVLKLPNQNSRTLISTEADNVAQGEKIANDNEMALEEHGLLLAIQAAHDPTTKNSTRTSNLHQKVKPSSRVSHSPRYATLNTPFSESDIDSYNDDDDASTFTYEIPPSELFLLVITIHFLNCFVQGIYVTLVPIWMVSVTARGGLDYGVRDCCMALSATGVVLLLIQSILGSKSNMALKVFPVRALRIGSGCVTIFSFLLSKFCGLNGISPWTESPTHSSTTLAKANSGTWILWTINSLFGHTYTVEADEVASGGEGLFLYYRPTPASNILSVLIPALLLGGIVSCVYLSRRSSSILLKISLTSVISSPATVENWVSALASILAPFVSCSIFLWAHRFNKNAPMDDSFFLSLIGTASFFVYLASMFLSLRFRGEFGIMPDDSVAYAQSDNSSESEFHMSSSSKSMCDPQHHDSNGNMVMSYMDCLSIPIQDVRYILAFYPGLRKKNKDNLLTSRLFNLKLEMKDS